jgi:hypothetical protein
MATRSAIGIKLENGNIMAVYCHWDGYPSHNGAILAENYTDPEKIKALISLGDISSLRPEIGIQHPFDTYYLSEEEKEKYKDMTTFYGRDRGEEDCGFHILESEADFLEYYDPTGAEYFYLYENGKWKISEYMNKFKNLSEVLAELETI